MAYIVQPTDFIFFVPDALLATYQAAGWVQATAGQVASDPYSGSQGAPPAPPLLGTSGVAPTPLTEVN